MRLNNGWRIAAMGLAMSLGVSVLGQAGGYPPAGTAKVSRYEALANRPGTMLQRERFPIAAAQSERIRASVVRLEGLATHDVVLGIEVYVPGEREPAVVSEEEANDLKETVTYIIASLSRLNEKSNSVTIEYVTLSEARIGYAVHRRDREDQELPATAYIEIPANPYIPQSGALMRLTPQLLQKIVTEGTGMMAEMRAGKK